MELVIRSMPSGRQRARAVRGGALVATLLAGVTRGAQGEALKAFALSYVAQ